MSQHRHQGQHDHEHGAGCGHTAILHGDHTDYCHGGHLHHEHGGGVAECQVAVDVTNPAACTPAHSCSAHELGHKHGAACGHEAIPHGDHVDFLVGGHLHHPHGGHCDDHGAITMG